MPNDPTSAVDEHIDAFFDNINIAIEQWISFERQKPFIQQGIKAVINNTKHQVTNDGKEIFYVGSDLGTYSGLDAAIESAGQAIERYMLAIHEMKAAFEKAWQVAETAEAISPRAEAPFMERDLVNAVFAQAMAAQAAWEQGLKAVMPAYRTFKVASTKQTAG